MKEKIRKQNKRNRKRNKKEKRETRLPHLSASNVLFPLRGGNFAARKLKPGKCQEKTRILPVCRQAFARNESFLVCDISASRNYDIASISVVDIQIFIYNTKNKWYVKILPSFLLSLSPLFPISFSSILFRQNKLLIK